MTAPRKPLVVCFDLGGVLVRICRSWAQGCAAAEIDPDRGWKPIDSEGAHHEAIEAYTVGAIDDDAFFLQLEQSSGGVYSAAEFRRLHTAWILGVYEGTESLLDDLRGSGVTITCLSNTNAAHWRQMADWQVLTLLDHRLASHELGCAKPGSEIYTIFSKTLEIEPSDIVFFDDLAENVGAARAMGWDAVPIDYTGDTASQMRQALASRGVVGV